MPGRSADGKDARWTPCKAVNSNKDLIALVQETDPEEINSIFLLVTLISLK